MSRGGARPGAGRKPKARSAVVLGMDGTRLSGGDAGAVDSQLAQVASELEAPPVDLTPEQQAFWRLYAPHALAQRTLVPATVIGFRELCEQFALKQAITARIAKVGAASKRATEPLKMYVKLAQRIDATLARFKLTSFGKPADSGAPKKTAANPWAQVAGK